jgi:hypothetical protein
MKEYQTGSSCKISPVSWVHITYTNQVCGTKKANIFLKADFLSRVETDSFTSNDFPILQLYEANVIMFFCYIKYNF